MITEFELGNIVKMKKPHACGQNSWEIIRVGADIKLKCTHCKRIVMLDRAVFVKRAVKILESRDKKDYN